MRAQAQVRSLQAAARCCGTCASAMTARQRQLQITNAGGLAVGGAMEAHAQYDVHEAGCGALQHVRSSASVAARALSRRTEGRRRGVQAPDHEDVQADGQALLDLLRMTDAARMVEEAMMVAMQLGADELRVRGRGGPPGRGVAAPLLHPSQGVRCFPPLVVTDPSYRRARFAASGTLARVLSAISLHDVEAKLPADEPRPGDAAGPQLRSGHLL